MIRPLVTPAAIVLLLAGCSGLLRSNVPPEQVYYLRAQIAQPENARPANLSSVRVGRPVPGPGLDSSHIMLLESDRRMSFYTASRWPAALPEVVEELTVEALRASGLWSDVQSSESSFPAEYLLQVRIRRFDADYETSSAAHAAAPPQVRVVLDCTLGRRSGREVIATFVAEGSASASDNKLGDVVAAFEVATNMALSSVVARVADAASAAGQKVDSPVTSITR
jgi:cholesterol transport system auxiliary component